MKLAESRFVTGPRDELAAVDVYEVQDSVPRNRAAVAIGGFIDGALGILRSTPGTGDALNLLSDLGHGRTMTPEQLQSRLDAILGFGKVEFRALSESMRNEILSQLGLEMNQTGAMQAKVAGNNVNVSPQNAEQVSLLTNMLKSMTDDETAIALIDLAAETALFSGLLKESVKAGVPEAVDILQKEASDPIVIKKAALESVAGAIGIGDISAIEKLRDLAGAKEILARHPNICQMILETYRFPSLREPDYDYEHERLLDLLRSFDEGWAYVTRNGIRITTLHPFSRASRDAIRLLSSSGGSRPFRSEAMIARNYLQNDLEDLMRKHYPLAAI